MQQISQRKKLELERRLGLIICPRTAEGKGDRRIGIFADETPITIYMCSVDGGAAREGLVGTLNSTQAFRPCSMKYAEKCPLYLNSLGYGVEPIDNEAPTS